jgi:dTDP-4-dehydrorhamnose 3,5-epimerase
MQVIKTNIDGPVIIEPDVYADKRGFFLEVWQKEKYVQLGITAYFVQDNHSRSTKGTLRGLHAQLEKPQAKLVRALTGRILDVAVDARIGSPTFGKYISVELSDTNHRQLFIPRGFLHGFCVISETADLEYKCDNFYDSSSEITIAYNDPDIGINWPLDAPLLSEKDANGELLKNCLDKLPKYNKT